MATKYSMIRMTQAEKARYDKLCESLGRGKQELFRQILDYLEKSGIDPVLAMEEQKGILAVEAQLRKMRTTLNSLPKSIPAVVSINEEQFEKLTFKLDMIIKEILRFESIEFDGDVFGITGDDDEEGEPEAPTPTDRDKNYKPFTTAKDTPFIIPD